MQRVAVVGSGGAGKTTFATELGRRTGLPVIHLDHLYWGPGWVATPQDVWRQRQSDHLSGEQWIADGNYAATYDLRFERADTVVVLSLSRWKCTYRVLRRSLKYRGRAVQSPGCPEHFDLEFLLWVWRYPTNTRPLLDAALQQLGAGTSVVQLTTSFEIQSFLDRETP